MTLELHYLLALLAIVAVAYAVDCEIPDGFMDDMGEAYQCYLDYVGTATPYCMVQCTMKAMHFTNEAGLPDHTKAVAYVFKKIPKGKEYEGLRKMMMGQIECLKTHGPNVDPHEDKSCKSYIKIGTCFKDAMAKECPEFT